MRGFVAKYWLWAVLSSHAWLLVWQIANSADLHVLHNLLEPSGETSARLLIFALCVTPLAKLLPGWSGSRWLIRNRRAIGVASFCYACLHLLIYLIGNGSFVTLIEQLSWTYILLGWVAFLLLLPLALTSTNSAVRRLGRKWKQLHRLAYLAAALTYLHWVAIYGGSILVNVTLNFAPILLLTVYRVWRRYAPRPTETGA